MKPYRILVTGSRDWRDADAVFGALHEARIGPGAAHGLVVVHGACPTGADALARGWARLHDELGVIEEAHPARWRVNGVLDRAAGFRRNAEMVALGADVCLAFIKDGSRGASHTAGLAEQASIPTRRWTA
ncbi:SLOG family protein [Streptomyces sp. YKOK-I1]